VQLGVREIARVFDVSEKTVYRWLAEDHLPSHELEGHHRFHRAEVLEWATSRDLMPAPEIFEDDDHAPAVSIARALSVDRIFYDVQAHDSASAAAAIVDRLNIAPQSERDLVREVLQARRGLGKTAVGDGIAIPHVRHPIVLDVKTATVTLCLLARPVDFGRFPVSVAAGQPVDAETPSPIHSVFVLVTPSVRAHLTVLSRLVVVAHDPAVRAAIRRRAPAAELVAAITHAETPRPPLEAA
jgi:PTS system nitrogen regulatory IIA component